MRAPACDFEGPILEASASGRWRPGLRRHLEACDSCADAALAAAWLAREGAVARAAAEPPAAALVWRQAQRRSRREKARRVASLLAGFQLAAASIAAVAAGSLLLLQWPALRQLGAGLAPVAPTLAATPALGGSALVLAAAAGTVATVAYGVYARWAEE